MREGLIPLSLKRDKDNMIASHFQYLEEDYLSYLVEKQDSKRLLEIEEDDLIYVKPADSSSWSL